MRKKILPLAVATAVLFGLHSCTGCVKKIAKSATETSLGAIEGVVEAIDEHGEVIGEKVTDATGKLATGILKSLDKQLNDHALKVTTSPNLSRVEQVDAFPNGFDDEIKKRYTELPYSANLASNATLDFFARYKNTSVIDAYFVIPEKGKYTSTFKCLDKDNNVFYSKDVEIDTTMFQNDKQYILVSFSLAKDDKTAFDKLENIRIKLEVAE